MSVSLLLTPENTNSQSVFISRRKMIKEVEELTILHFLQRPTLGLPDEEPRKDRQ